MLKTRQRYPQIGRQVLQLRRPGHPALRIRQPYIIDINALGVILIALTAIELHHTVQLLACVHVDWKRSRHVQGALTGRRLPVECFLI